jgi:large subunit ribosomal protein L10
VPTAEKVATVEKLRERFDGARTVVLTEYRGLTVQQLNDLRKQLRAVSAEYKVVKNRLARLAGQGTGLDALQSYLKGPTGAVISNEDPVSVAKTLQTFARTNQALALKVGYVEGRVLPAAQLRALADLPSKDVLRAQLVGVVQGPLAQLVGLLTAVHRDLAYVLAERGKAAAESDTAGSEAAPARSEATPAGSEAAPAGSEHAPEASGA